MIAIHAMVGILIVAISIVLTLWNVIRIGAKLKGPSLRPVLMGLIDLQLLLGIVTIIMYPHSGLFLLHPLTMIIAAVVFHLMTGKKKTESMQRSGFLVTTVLLILGVYFGNL